MSPCHFYTQVGVTRVGARCCVSAASVPRHRRGNFTITCPPHLAKYLPSPVKGFPICQHHAAWPPCCRV
ncbi:hypothetical protein BDR04DRAFT_672077 [Suillus decipiens]|nr:hypothetical protein BDR04DRAFT_672077 [Suillus decipiens]